MCDPRGALFTEIFKNRRRRLKPVAGDEGAFARKCRFAARGRLKPAPTNLLTNLIAWCYEISHMSLATHSTLSRRERLIMDVLYRLGRATANEVRDNLPGDPAYSTVRAQLRVLEEKGHVRHEEEGLRYVYVPKVRREKLQQSVLRYMIETFFEGSPEKAVAALLGKGGSDLSEEQLERMSELIEKAKKEGKRK